MINENLKNEAGMHPADIKSALEKKGYSQMDICKEFDVSPASVNHVIYGRAVSKRIADSIATKIGKAVADIWPGKYDDQAA